MSGGGRFDFDDGGTYCGGWEDGKAHGHGVCTGPKGQGEYSGAWAYGFEASGVYTWPSGNNYQGQWLQGKRHGLGIETKGRWVYRGEWTQGFKGRYGVRHSTSSGAKYEGTWTTGLQDGYGVETYADGGSYQGQWLRGMRHGYGVRQSVPYGLASHYRPKALRASLTSLRSEAEEDHVVKDRDRKVDESRGGFVLKAKSDESPTQRRRSLFDKHGRSSLRKGILNGLKLRKQKSTGDIKDSPRRPTGSVRSTVSNISNASADSSASGVTSASMYTDSNLSFVSQDDINDVNVTETYMGEWKNDKRSGFGISERSDGLKYEGEWYNNKKYGYGVTTFKDGTREEGKYKNNILISSGKKSKLFLIRSSKMRERVDNAVSAAQRAAQIAHQKADIAITRMANARAKAEQAEAAAEQSLRDSELARVKAKEFAPEFVQQGTDILRQRMPPDSTRGYSTDPQPHRSRSVMSQPANHHRAPSPQTFKKESYPRKGASPMSALVSSALDCAIGPGSVQVADHLRKLESNDTLGQEPRSYTSQPYDDRFDDRYSPAVVAPSPDYRWENNVKAHTTTTAAAAAPTASQPPPTMQVQGPPHAREGGDYRGMNIRDQHQQHQPPTARDQQPRGTWGQRDMMMAEPRDVPRDPREAMRRTDPRDMLPEIRGGDPRDMMRDPRDPRDPRDMRDSRDPRERQYMPQTNSRYVNETMLPNARYGDRANSTHLEGIRTMRDDSGLGVETDTSPDGLRQPFNQQGSLPNSRLYAGSGGGGGYGGTQTLDRSPDSGLSDSEDFRYKNRPLVRRKTLPSIMKAPPGGMVANAVPGGVGSGGSGIGGGVGGGPISGTNNAQIAPSRAGMLSATPGGGVGGGPGGRDSGPDTTGQSPELYVIENGTRKRVKAEVYAQPVRPEADKPKDVLPNRLRLEKMSSTGSKGSLPDVSVCHELEKNLMPREVVAKLSEKRRAELIAMQDEEARRKEQEIVLRLSDLKDWCQQRQLMMLVIAVNVSLATMFFNLLSQ